MTLRKSMIVLAFGLPLAAEAQPIQGLYLGGGIGGIQHPVAGADDQRSIVDAVERRERGGASSGSLSAGA